MKSLVYLDNNATTPLAPFLKNPLIQKMEEWGNPSSVHYAGRGPKKIIREARQNLAKLLKVSPLELIFTSGGSEANNLALQGIFFSQILPHLLSSFKNKDTVFRNRFIISAVEHPSVFKTAEYLKTFGLKLDILPINKNGQVDLNQLQSLLGEDVAMASIMYANNETGHIFPINKISKMLKSCGALLHCDAVQAFGKLPLNLNTLGADLVSFSSHKVYSLKGSGLLYVKKGVHLNALIQGGGQERFRRAGTENTLSIASLGLMAEHMLKEKLISNYFTQMQNLRDFMEEEIIKNIKIATIIGKDCARLPNTSNILFSNLNGDSLLVSLDLKSISLSTGSACSSGSSEPSSVLKAMGYSDEQANSSLRISLGWQTSKKDIVFFVKELIAVVKHLSQL
ncbi:MAG: cysteine desulfurase [Bdellovibrionaceae bacterium]|nr:cysteine desulfurase [Pseudobdellovibrionaceae bacterium]